MMLSTDAWSRIWQELGAARADESLRQGLMDAYRERHRHYHTLRHLRDCLLQFEEVRDQARRPAEIALALWFHDAVYDPHRKDNEARSAEWARSGVLQAGLGEQAAARIHGLVMATRHEIIPQDPDAQLLTDVDLSILGAEQRRFDESDVQIRAEYAHVPEAEFREGRKRVLHSFLDRSRIYSTPHFHSALEARARENLERALARLG